MTLNAWLAIAAVAAILVSPLLVVTAPLWLLWLAAQERRRRREEWQALLPFMAGTLESTAEAMIRGAAPADGWSAVARSADRYLATLRLSRRWRAQLVVLGLEFAPCLTGRRPMSLLPPPARRAFVDRHLATTRGLFGLASLGRQLVRMGYYRAADRQLAAGFVAYEQRRRVLAARTPASSAT